MSTFPSIFSVILSVLFDVSILTSSLTCFRIHLEHHVHQVVSERLVHRQQIVEKVERKDRVKYHFQKKNMASISGTGVEVQEQKLCLVEGDDARRVDHSKTIWSYLTLWKTCFNVSRRVEINKRNTPSKCIWPRISTSAWPRKMTTFLLWERLQVVYEKKSSSSNSYWFDNCSIWR